MRNVEYRPELLSIGLAKDRGRFEALLRDGAAVYDGMKQQVLELMLCRHASMSRKEVEQAGLVADFMRSTGETEREYGTWVYYSWKHQLVHVLPEEEFIEVRTNRNCAKLSRETQQMLRSKRIGIAGLSVGRSIAMTLATERLAGEFYLADFDSIELSNLNRITAPLTELGQNKALSCAREMAEMDPYIKVYCFTGGLNKDNLESFLNPGKKLDVFIEECDDLYIKVQSRLKCRELGIPVIMETNDRCQVDIERFDQEPERPIFHGKLEGMDLRELEQDLSMEQKLAFLSRIVDIAHISAGMRRSLPLMGRDIRSWPQLASEVNLGAGAVGVVIQRLFEGEDINTGVYYFEA